MGLPASIRYSSICMLNGIGNRFVELVREGECRHKLQGNGNGCGEHTT